MKIELHKISLTFKDQKLFSDLSLNIAQGEKVWLQGPSGSGKSTLMKIIFGFQQPNSGEVVIDGNILNARNINAIRSGMGYVAQNIPLPKLKVGRFVDELIQFEANRKLGLSKDVVLKTLEKYGLEEDVLDKNTEELSGGERQRLGFGLLTLLDREIWLLDEVTSGLDNNNAKLIIKEVEETKATVVVISHDKIWEKLNLKKIQINE
ncbi:MAG: hypothetical protein C0599_10800 [Salinivirgaceae bacterium]|nr:MAG: hypothetical protein C0599_10800 [Salinivirgaceae bacterium]